jgi:hypothetical protein
VQKNREFYSISTASGQRSVKIAIFDGTQNTKYDWVIDDVMLGRGTSGQVYRAKDQKTGEVCALKFVRYKSERDMAFAGIL